LMPGWMSNLSRRFICDLFITMTVSVYASTTSAIEKKISGKGNDSAVVVPGDDFELCTGLEKGQSIEYEFNASRPLIFNLHYHVKEQVSYPVRSSLAISKQSTYLAEKSMEYCLMWTNYGKTTAKLYVTYQISSRSK